MSDRERKMSYKTLKNMSEETKKEYRLIHKEFKKNGINLIFTNYKQKSNILDISDL